MLVISCRIVQLAAPVFKMDVSCITTQQIVYKPVYVPSSVSISESKSGIMLTILIMIKKFRTAINCVQIYISGRQMDILGTFNPGIVTGQGVWRARQRPCRLWSPLSASVGWRCTCSFGSPACLQNVCGASLARNAARCLVLTKHCRVSLYRSLHLVMHRKLHTPLLLYSDLGVWCLNEIICSLYCSM